MDEGAAGGDKMEDDDDDDDGKLKDTFITEFFF